ncbi:WhiB family transcriptional regulator [Streptomyces sp. NPDC059949]|uniref:WhiB family transcriptional regulator n=1 Tax=Streptomyces sp. NPDC059949 TaxID=3347013 RepID=UPI00364E060D
MTILDTSPTLAPPRIDWRQAAACTGLADLFFPHDDRRDEPQAKKICRRCPVRTECLNAALAEEGTANQWARYGIRGGLNPRQRAEAAGARASKAKPLDPHDYAETDELLRAGTMSDTEISDRTGIPASSIHRRRAELGLPTLRQRATEQSVYEAHAHPVEGGHVEWRTAGGGKRPQVNVRKRNYTVGHLAFLLGHGREPEGHVKAICGHRGCIAWEHLTDKVIRASRVTTAAP